MGFRTEPYRSPFNLALGFWIVSFVLCCVAYGTGFWYEGYGEDRKFRRLGLWEACFDGYEHTSDYVGKAYYGCWWIFHKEYSYIREWIMPTWFIGVQTLMTFAIFLEFVVLGMLVIYGPMCKDTEGEVKYITTTTFLAGLCSACLTVSVTVFGVMIGEDRTWMPRFDINRLGWSFGLAVISGFMAVFATISLTVYTLVVRYYELPPEDHHAQMGSKSMIAMVPPAKM